MKNVLVVYPLREAEKARLEALSAECRYVYAVEPAAEQVREANIILGSLPPALLKSAEHLEFLQLHYSGADAYVKPGVLPEGAVLASATGAYGQSVSEHAFAMTWMLLKKLHLYRDDQTRVVWTEHGRVGTLRGATVLVVGLGDIGLQYAQMAKAMGSYVIGVKRRPSALPEGVDELVLTENLDSVLPRADVVFCVLPGTNDTFHLFNDERFALMKPGAVFINCGRGNVVDGMALCRALENGRLAAAGTDVTEVEPLPPEHPLWKQPNMLITPHVAGNEHLPATHDRIAEILLYNFDAFLNGKPLKSAIDFSTGYKK